MPEFVPGDLILKVFAANIPGGDWLCTVWTREGQLHGEIRFRYHAGPGFDAPDTKKIWTVLAEDAPGIREDLYTKMRAMAKDLHFTDFHERDVNGDAFKLMDALNSLPGWSLKYTRHELPKS